MVREELIRWKKPGWYAPAQRGSHENTRVEYYFLGDDEFAPDTYSMGLETPSWFPSWWETDPARSTRGERR